MYPAGNYTAWTSAHNSPAGHHDHLVLEIELHRTVALFGVDLVEHTQKNDQNEAGHEHGEHGEQRYRDHPATGCP